MTPNSSGTSVTAGRPGLGVPSAEDLLTTPGAVSESTLSQAVLIVSTDPARPIASSNVDDGARSGATYNRSSLKSETQGHASVSQSQADRTSGVDGSQLRAHPESTSGAASPVRSRPKTSGNPTIVPESHLATQKPNGTNIESMPQKDTTATHNSQDVNPNTTPLATSISQHVSSGNGRPGEEATSPISVVFTATNSIFDGHTNHGGTEIFSAPTTIDQTSPIVLGTPTSADGSLDSSTGGTNQDPASNAPTATVDTSDIPTGSKGQDSTSDVTTSNVQDSGLPISSTEQLSDITSAPDLAIEQETTAFTSEQTNPTAIGVSDETSAPPSSLSQSLPVVSTGGIETSTGTEQSVPNTIDDSNSGTSSADGTILTTDPASLSAEPTDVTRLPDDSTGTDGPDYTADVSSSAINSHSSGLQQGDTSLTSASEAQPTSDDKVGTVESTAGSEETSAVDEPTEPVAASTEAADPKSTATRDEPQATNTQGPVTKGHQTTITGTDGVVATWSATRDPELSDNSQTVTQTDDDGGFIIIFPGGWKWTKPSGGNLLGPTPTSNPGPVDGEDNNGPDDEDEDEDEDEEDCTTTTPPKCTMTLSYISQEGSITASTVIGSCSPVTGCVSCQQSTTTTTIAPDIPRITGDPDDVPDEGPIRVEPVNRETADYYKDLFEEWGIANDDSEEPEASCDGLTLGAKAECLGVFAKAFCDVVEEDETQEVSRNFAYDDIADCGKDIAARACASHVFNFDWTGADGNCNLSCLEAFNALQEQCNNHGFLELAREGTIDVGCGNYTYQVDLKASETMSSTELMKETSTTVATSTAAPSTTEEPELEPTQDDAALEIQNLQCNSEDDFPGHADINLDSVLWAVNKACTSVKDDNMHMSPVYKPYAIEQEDLDTHQHRFTWSWIEDCTMDNEYVVLYDPFDEGEINKAGEYRCTNILYQAWSQCNNGGVGGSQDVGCVRYLIESGI
ncbi:hypothetical protein NW762_006141 [Fusarium torreyae]|uniref:Uncharacterized protein n=1 Tax=Fusarium torreyae TaxID=1237075 RepID=A0A9W8S224_9HYPO|nr:hypothetical protein NW762_006141 [Fusarium torreyae]